MNKVKIVLFTDTVYDLNGVSRFLNDFANISDNSFSIISSTKKCAFLEKKNIYNISPFFKFSMPFYKELDLVFPNPFKMAKILKSLAPNLVHISTPGPIGLVGLFLAKRYKIPKAGIYHTDFPEYIYKNTNSKICKNISKIYLRLFYKNFEAIFVRSEEYKDIVIHDLKIDKSKIFTLKAGIDTEKFDLQFRNIDIWEEYKIRAKSFKILYVGRVTKEKNIEFLIEIFKELYKLCVNIDLIIVGNGEFLKYKDSLKNYNIHFLGIKKGIELSTIYASSDVFIFPSTTDTLGQVVLEAMSSSLPVLVTNEGGPKEFVKLSNAGYILDVNNKNEWIDAILKLQNDYDLYEEYSTNAKSFMSNRGIKNSYEDFCMKNSSIFQSLQNQL